MKLFVLAVIALSLQACGPGPASGYYSPTVVVNTPGSPNISVLTLTASMSEPGDLSVPGTYTVTRDTAVTVPSNLLIIQNASDHGWATINFGPIQAYYQWNIDPVLGTNYRFQDCTGCTAGQQLSLHNGDAITLFLQSGYLTQNTIVQANVTTQY